MFSYFQNSQHIYQLNYFIKIHLKIHFDLII